MDIDSKIEYKLKFLLNSLTLKLYATESLMNNEDMIKFNNTYCNTTRVQAFCSAIEKTTLFPIHGVPLEKNSIVHTIYFCEVATGNSICVSEDYCKQDLPIPKDYDSLITDNTNISKYLCEESVNLSAFSYVIKDKKKILPLYKVIFEYDEEFEKNARNKNICHKCKKFDAIVFCPSERASFCNECDHIVHFDEFLKRHERKYFAEVGQKKFISCKHHNTKTVEFYCKDCQEPLCSYCKVNGAHATADCIDHKIVLFTDACKDVNALVAKPTQKICAIPVSITTEMVSFRENVVRFRNNINETRSQIEKEFKNLILKINSIESVQRQVFNANFLEMLNQSAIFSKIINFPQELDAADQLQYIKEIVDQRNVEKLPEFTIQDLPKTEILGKIQIKTPTGQDLRVFRNSSESRSIGWRIENPKMNKKNFK